MDKDSNLPLSAINTQAAADVQSAAKMSRSHGTRDFRMVDPHLMPDVLMIPN